MSVSINGSTGKIVESNGTLKIGSTVELTDSATLPAAALDWTNATLNGNKLTGNVDASILSGTAAAINGSAITNLAAGSIATGTLAAARLPNNLGVASGSANNVLTSDGSGGWTSSAPAGGGGLKSCQVFTSSGTWSKPSGIATVRVQLVGSGAGGRNWGPAGGAGGYSEKVVDVSSIASVSVTVGAVPSTGGAGNTSSFGSHLSATGGAIPSGAGNGGLGGTGTGGNINIDGGGGWTSGNTSPYNSNSGGISYFGGGGAATQTGPTSPVNSTNGAWGAGGGSTHNGYTAMPNPRSGIVIVWEYE
jgi:hypothetical protein